MGFTDVIGDRGTVAVNLHPAAYIRHIKILLRVTQAVGINNLNCRRITGLTVTKPVRTVLQNRQRVTVQQLVTESQPQHLRYGLFTFNITVPALVICP